MPRIVRFHRTGGPEVLCLEEAPPEQPREGEVLIRNQAIGLNNSEAQLRRGDYPMLTADLPSRIGRECAGIVEAIGPSVTTVKPNDLVSTIPAFDVKRNGVYGEWCVVPEVGVARVPMRLSRLEAAAVWQQYLTAYGPLVLNSRLEPSMTVLITAAASSVGLGAIQVAKLFGTRVIATTRTASKEAIIRSAGADDVIITSHQPLVASVNHLTDGRGFDLGLDPIAGPGIADLIDCAAPEAAIHLYGQLAGEPSFFPLRAMLRKGLTVRGYTLWEITLNPARREAAKQYIFNHLDSGKLRPIIDRVFPLESVVEAHRYLESGRQAGKIVIEVAGNVS
jgi:NADPH:quinone reductase-like Zn-dependent oxidoreductase